MHQERLKSFLGALGIVLIFIHDALIKILWSGFMNKSPFILTRCPAGRARVGKSAEALCFNHRNVRKTRKGPTISAPPTDLYQHPPAPRASQQSPPSLKRPAATLLSSVSLLNLTTKNKDPSTRQTPPVSSSIKSHRQRSLVGCSPWGGEESGMTEWLAHSIERHPVWRMTPPSLPVLGQVLKWLSSSSLSVIVKVTWKYFI